MSLHSSDSPANFDRIARVYQALEYASFGRTLQRCRLRLLPQVTGGRHALLLGDGDGRFLARLLAANPALRADAVDTSATMLRLLRRRCERAVPEAAGRLRTHLADAREFEPPPGTDLVVTHFFLDCLTELETRQLAIRLAAKVRPGCLWLLSEFNIPRGPSALPARVLVRALYLAFRVLTGLRVASLPDHAEALKRAKFVRVAEQTSLAGILRAELWRLVGAPDAP